MRTLFEAARLPDRRNIAGTPFDSHQGKGIPFELNFTHSQISIILHTLRTSPNTTTDDIGNTHI